MTRERLFSKIAVYAAAPAVGWLVGMLTGALMAPGQRYFIALFVALIVGAAAAWPVHRYVKLSLLTVPESVVWGAFILFSLAFYSVLPQLPCFQPLIAYAAGYLTAHRAIGRGHGRAAAEKQSAQTAAGMAVLTLLECVYAIYLATQNAALAGALAALNPPEGWGAQSIILAGALVMSVLFVFLSYRVTRAAAARVCRVTEPQTHW